MHRPFRVLVLLACAFGLAGCLTSRSVAFKATPPALPAPLYERMPLKVGIWYDEIARAHHAKGTAQGRTTRGEEYAVTYDIDFGDTHLEVLTRTFASTFAETVTLAERPAGPAIDASLDLLILAEVQWVQFGPDAEVKYKLTLKRPDGSDLTSYMAKGAAGEYTPEAQRMAAALRDASAQIMVRLAENDALGHWVKGRGRQSLQPEPSTIVAQAQRFAVLPERLDVESDEEWADCIQGGIRRNQSIAAEMPTMTLRDALFPWVEISTKPYHLSDVIELLNRPLIRKRLQSIGVRYLTLVGGGSLGSWAPGATCPFIYCPFGEPGSLGQQHEATGIDIGPAGAKPSIIGQAVTRGGCWALGGRAAEMIEAAARQSSLR